MKIFRYLVIFVGLWLLVYGAVFAANAFGNSQSLGYQLLILTAIMSACGVWFAVFATHDFLGKFDEWPLPTAVWFPGLVLGALILPKSGVLLGLLLTVVGFAVFWTASLVYMSLGLFFMVIKVVVKATSQ